MKKKLKKQQTKMKAIHYKGGSCQHCGYDKCTWAFEFHHLNPEDKSFTISKGYSFLWTKLKKELDKCLLLCANCHRELHYRLYVEKKGNE